MPSAKGRAAAAAPPLAHAAPYDDYDRPFFTVSQVAEMLDVQQAFLRRLDSQDVVSPARSEGQQRRYSRRDIDQVVAACALVDDGLTLAGIKQVFALRTEVAALKAEIAELKRIPR